MKTNLFQVSHDRRVLGGTFWVVSFAWLLGCGSNEEPNNPSNDAGSSGQATPGGATGNGGGGRAGSSSVAGAPAPMAGSGNAGSGSAGAPVASGGRGGGAAQGGGAQGGTQGSAGAGTGGAAAGAAGAAGAKASTCTTDEEKKFSVFVTSQAGLVRLSGKADGFGGDLGGITGADSICQRLAESSSPCQSSRVWRAFLSTTTVDAIDRIGEGPWYDRRGRLLANGKADLLPTGNTEETGRPKNADPEIKNDFPNEDGFPNQYPDGGTMEVDNHQVVTGSGNDGRIYKQTGAAGMGTSATGCQDAAGWTREAATCWDWTSSEPKGCPRVGHSWGAFSGFSWISVWNESGCAPGGTLRQVGGPDTSRKIGSGGGYGGFYCFAVTP